MDEKHAIIDSFLKAVENLKGKKGAVTRLDADARQEQVTRRVGFDRTRPVIVQEKPDPYQPANPETDGVLYLGDRVIFRGVSPCTGYIHFFNFGTSGSCIKLAPSAEYPDNRVAANEEFLLPSPKFLQGSCVPTGDFLVEGPATADKDCDALEILFVVITRDNIDLHLPDLDPRLPERDALTRCPTRGNFLANPTSAKPKLFQLPLDGWEYGLFKMEVRRQAG